MKMAKDKYSSPNNYPIINGLSVESLAFLPSMDHIQHFLTFHLTQLTAEPLTPIQPFLDLGMHSKLYGSTYLHLLVDAKLKSRYHGVEDWLYPFAAARIAYLRICKYYLDEAIKHDPSKSKELNPLLKAICVEKDLTLLMAVRHACVEHGVSLHRDYPNALYPFEKGYLITGLSINYIDQMLTDMSKHPVINTSGIKDKFIKWLKDHKRKSKPAPQNLDLLKLALSPNLILLNAFKKNYSQEKLLKYWLHSIDHPAKNFEAFNSVIEHTIYSDPTPDVHFNLDKNIEDINKSLDEKLNLATYQKNSILNVFKHKQDLVHEYFTASILKKLLENAETSFEKKVYIYTILLNNKSPLLKSHIISLLNCGSEKQSVKFLKNEIEKNVKNSNDMQLVTQQIIPSIIRLMHLETPLNSGAYEKTLLKLGAIIVSQSVDKAA